MTTSEGRVSIDCRNYPSDSNCSLFIAGTQEEVEAAAVEHAISWHKHDPSEADALRQEIRQAISPPGR